MQKININYQNIIPDEIYLIKSLWERIRDHHSAKTTYFKERYQNMTFEKRKAALFEKSKNGKLMICVVEDTDKQKLVAYCASSIVNELGEIIGEIDSIYIDSAYRKLGIGNNLMTRAIEWLDSEKAQEKRILVCEGNEEVFEFYKKFGFFHLHNILQQKDIK